MLHLDSYPLLATYYIPASTSTVSTLLILTHFSQNYIYPSLTAIVKNNDCYFTNTAFYLFSPVKVEQCC